jgi:uncharacterized membrane protein
MNRWRWLSVAATLCALGASLYLYLFRLDALAERVPIHWDIHGLPDGTAQRDVALFIMPAAMAGFIGLTALLPWLSPRPFTVESFRPTYEYTMSLVVVLCGYIHAIMLVAGLSPDLSSGRWLIGGLFLFFALLGNVLGKLRRNFWAGVRTPWTLASEKVWYRTHRLAGYLMVAAGLVGFVAVVAGVNLLVAFVLILVAALVPVLYSLWLYKHLDRLGQLDVLPASAPVGQQENGA